MNTPAQILHRSLSLAGLAIPFILTPILMGQSWDGGDVTSTSWGAPNNWDPNGVPAFTTSTNLTFNNVTRPNNFLGGANRIVSSISYGANVDSSFNTNFLQSLSVTARSLTLQAASGNASLAVDADATGNISLGWDGLGTVGGGALILGSNLDITHNGTGVLSITRQINGTGFGFNKLGSGTMQFGAANANGFTGALNVSAGRLIAATTQSATGDFNSASSVSLNGGTLEFRTTSALDKTINPNLTVTTASTLAYNNTTATTRTLTLQTGTMVLDANLTIQNISTETTLNNLIEVSRSMTGAGNLSVETYNNISAIGNGFTPGRVQLSGNNSGWSGDFVIAKGTGQLSGTATSSGTGKIVIGTASNAFGAGLATNVSATTTWTNDIEVTAGGFRGIRHVGGGAADVAFSGNMTLNGDLSVGYSQDAGRTFSLSGDKSGAGDLTITRVGGDVGGYAVVGGVNTYLGDTNVVAGALVLNGSATSNINIDATSRFGGDGSTSGNLTFASGALFIFSPTASLDVSGTVSLPASFGVSSLVNADGSAINWASISSTVYTLVNGTGGFSGISNFGIGNAFNLGDGRHAYFQEGSLQLVVAAIPEPGTFAFIGGIATLGFTGLRRRRRAV